MRKRIVLLLAAALSLGLGAGCTTMYDAHGRPVEVMTPEGTAVTALAAGVLGYAIADSRDNRRHHRYHRGRGYHRGHGYHGGHGYHW